MDVSEAKRLRALEDENAKLKKLLAEAMLDIAVLKDLISKNGNARRDRSSFFNQGKPDGTLLLNVNNQGTTSVIEGLPSDATSSALHHAPSVTRRVVLGPTGFGAVASVFEVIGVSAHTSIHKFPMRR